MKMKPLKETVYRIWEMLSTSQLAIVQPENFQPEIRTYGDLRRKSTWEKALVVFWAKVIWSTNSDNITLITTMFNPRLDDWSYEYRYQVFEEFIAIPGAMELVRITYKNS